MYFSIYENDIKLYMFLPIKSSPDLNNHLFNYPNEII